MASQGRLGKVWLPALVGLGLSACIAIPVQEHGYGGSGSSSVNPSAARAECLHVARGFPRYQSVSAGPVNITGPETARVLLQAVGPFGRHEALGCTYNARTGRAFVR